MRFLSSLLSVGLLALQVSASPLDQLQRHASHGLVLEDGQTPLAPLGDTHSTYPTKGITYSPYTATSGCKSADLIKNQVKALKGYELIRTYGVDCNQVDLVLDGMDSSQKLFVGIYDMNQIEQGCVAIHDAVSRHGGWDRVHTVSIGNELVNDGEASPAQIGEYVSKARSKLRELGYKGDVVAVDTFNAVLAHHDLCDHSDYMAVNAHPFFAGDTPSKDAGQWVLSQIQNVWHACSGKKKVMISETGWPTRGNNDGVAHPSKEDQKEALDAIVRSCGNDVIIFNAYNDMWKNPGPWGVEKYWGIID